MSVEASRYRELLSALLLERELAGGALPDEIESERVEALDECWWAMTNAEQEEIERSMATEARIEAPSDLGAQDVEVEEGKHVLPRKAA